MNRTLGGGSVGAIPEGAESELSKGEAAEDFFGPHDIPDNEIEFVKEGETIEVANNEPLLEAGEDEGQDMPYTCREEQCVSLAGQIADGDFRHFVEHDNQQMLDEPELEDGYV